MAAQVGDEVIWNGVPATVVRVQLVGGVQYDTILMEQPVARVVPDSQVTTTPPPAPPAPAGPAAPATPARPTTARPGHS